MGRRYRTVRDRKRSRRWRLLGPAAVVLVALIIALTLMLRVPGHLEERVQRAMHPLEYEQSIVTASERYDVEPALVAGVIHTESRFRPQAESSQGAYGLMQILPETAEFISQQSGIQGDYREPEVNVFMGTWYLSYLEGEYPGDERVALAAYNAGRGNVDGWTQSDEFDVEDDIPFPETREYVQDVREARDTYAELYGSGLDGDSG